MKFVTWNVRSLCRAGSLKNAARKLATCMSRMLGVQEFIWYKGDSEPADDYELV
jgi:hypothetical protein